MTRFEMKSDEIIHRLTDVEPVPLALALVCLTGDLDVLEMIRPHVSGAASWANDVPDSMRLDIARRVAERLRGEVAAPAIKDAELIRRMMSVAVAQEVPSEYVPMLIDQIDLFGTATATPRPNEKAKAIRAVIIGAGISGICAAVKLAEAGIDYIILEKNSDVGGTWLENVYPGCAVDTPNHFYQYSFLPNSDWTQYFSPQSEILEYIKDAAVAHDVPRHIRFNCSVDQAAFDEKSAIWTVTYTNERGEPEAVSANLMIAAVGQLNQPAFPAINGLADFDGPVVHTAQWDNSLDVQGKRIALIGTGASAIQVGPAIADQVDKLYVLQRSGSWIVRNPNLDQPVSDNTRWALRHVPFFAAWYRFQLFWGAADGLFPALRVEEGWEDEGRSISRLNRKIRDAMLKYMHQELEARPDLIDKCTPDYPPYGKRVLQDTGWFKMLQRDNVALETTPIEHCTGSSIVLRGGGSIEVDAIILATGFQAANMLSSFNIVGSGGRSIRDRWQADDPRAFLGIVVPEFPNMFVLYGPNTNLGHGGSAIFLVECQMRYVMSCVQIMLDRDLASIEIRREVHDEYNKKLDEEMRNLVWTHPSVKSWYRNSSGRVVTNQPWRLVDYWKLTQFADPGDFVKRQADPLLQEGCVDA